MLLLIFLSVALFKYGGTSTCELMIDGHPCKDVIASKTLVPNLLSHSSQEIAINELSELALNDECSGRLKFFLCSIYAPPCATDATNHPIPPCRGLCENVRANCDIRWPDRLNCSKFPEDGGYCKCENGSSIAKAEKKFTCRPLPPQPVCQYQNTTLMPNLAGEDNLEIAVATNNRIIPLIQMGCSPHLATLTCSIVLPNCTDVGVPYPPCRDLCQSVRTGCEPVIKSFGFAWPEQLDCDIFPDNLCVSYNGSIIAHEDTEDDLSNYSCVDIESDSMCKEFSDKTILPNLMNLSDQHEANDEITKLSPLISMDCNPELKKFLCSIHFTQCAGNRPKPPCKSLCENVKNGCAKILSMIGFQWPEEYNCDKFRNSNCVKSVKVRKSHRIRDADLLVTLPSGGQLRGSIMETTSNKHPIFAFRGIPFAEPPIGDLRFRPPVPMRLKAGEKPFDATKEGPECPQVEFFNKALSGVEDCLVLNVYTRRTNKSDNLRPVMVSIHGGGFTMGSGASYIYSPKRLLDYDIVLVTINYRLNLFGFLSTNDDASPGNYGLMDQTEALKWVRDNIAVFNGDPNNVNIFGVSAGGASVLYHMLSPLSKGLFHTAIAQSGTTLSPWAEESESETILLSLELADDVGCTTTNSTKMVQCLRMMPAERLTQQLQIYMETTMMSFGPVTDGTFLPNSSLYLLEHGKINKVPLITGITEFEGAMIFAIEFKNREVHLTDDFLVRVIAVTANTRPQFVTQSAIDLVRKEYFHSVDPNDSKMIRESASKVFGDYMFVAPHFQTVHFLNKCGSEPFVYSYDLLVKRGFAAMLGMEDLDRTTHGDDAAFLFFSEFINSEVNQTEHVMLEMWTKFAEYGHPTKFIDTNITEWPVSAKDEIKIYHLNHDFHVEPYDAEIDKLIKFWFQDFQKAMKVH